MGAKAEQLTLQQKLEETQRELQALSTSYCDAKRYIEVLLRRVDKMGRMLDHYGPKSTKEFQAAWDALPHEDICYVYSVEEEEDILAHYDKMPPAMPGAVRRRKP